MYNKIQKLAEAATLLDSMGETKMANQLDKLIERLAADPRDPTAGVPYMGPTSPNDRWDGRNPQSTAPSRNIQMDPANVVVDRNKEHSKTKGGPHKGMLAVQQKVNQYIDAKKKANAEHFETVTKVSEDGNQGDKNTWSWISNPNMGFGLKSGTDFKNYEQLLKLMDAKIQSLAPAPVQPKEPWKVPPRRDVPPVQDRGTTIGPDGSIQLRNTGNPFATQQQQANPAAVNATTFEGDRNQYQNVEMAPNKQYAVHSEKAGQGWVTTYYKTPDQSGSRVNPNKVRHTARG